MNPRIQIGRGITGAMRYVLGEGRDPETGQFAQRTDGQRRVVWVSGQGFGFGIESDSDAEMGRRIMEYDALRRQTSRTRPCKLDCVHLTLSWRPGEKPTREQMEAAAQSALAAIGMARARAIFVAHNDEDYAHVHIVASRIDPKTGRAFDMERNYLKLSAWAQAYERDNGGIISTRRVVNNELRAAIAARNAAGVLEALTKRNATFTASELETALGKEIRRDTAARERFSAEILAHTSVVKLAEAPGGPVVRFTTRAVLEAEHYVLRAAAALVEDRNRHSPDDQKRAEVLSGQRFEGLTREQLRAIRHATGREGIALIDGQAGTGKSFTIGAIREIYERSGDQVIGLAPTNAVAQDMRADGFARAGTIHSELFALNNRRISWDRKTVVVVDEAAMVDTRLMSLITAHAVEAGAKLLLVGDDRQLSSIDRGGMFAVLKRRHGAVELREVKRQRKADERRAAEMMASGDFHNALAIYEKKNAIAWTRTQGEARTRLVRHWARDAAHDQSKTRFVFAYTNDAVAELNAALRAVRKKRGELGTELRFDTARGAFDFAINDRIQFTTNDKAKGIVNGFAGRITALAEDRITVLLDGRKARSITFDSYEFTEYRHGYAGTIYRGQGKTLDETYLYHSEHWRSAASYVALTRHREKTEIFVARNTARDIKQLAKQMARNEERRAASAFYHDLDLMPLRPLTARQILERFGGPDFRPRAPQTRRAPMIMTSDVPARASNDNSEQHQDATGAAGFEDADVRPLPPYTPTQQTEPDHSEQKQDARGTAGFATAAGDVSFAPQPPTQWTELHHDQLAAAPREPDVARPLQVDSAGGTKNRLGPGDAIRALFRKTAKAVTKNADTPKPKTRRRGDSQGELRRPAHARSTDRSAARGRYTKLWRAGGEARKASARTNDFADLAATLCTALLGNGLKFLGRLFKDVEAAVSDEFDQDGGVYASGLAGPFSPLNPYGCDPPPDEGWAAGYDPNPPQP
jgi:Ti-type conjugative transfer relaxase TraA